MDKHNNILTSTENKLKEWNRYIEKVLAIEINIQHRTKRWYLHNQI